MSVTEVSLSVVIPTYNRRDQLDRVLWSLTGQEADEPFEVIVVSDGCTDDTVEHLASTEYGLQVQTVVQDNKGPASARNNGAAHARGRVLVFLDDDVVADRGLIQAHISAHRNLGALCVVIGPMLVPPDHDMSPWVAWEQEMLDKQYTAMNAGVYQATARQLYTGNASLRSVFFHDVGGFNESLRRSEDVELGLRLGNIGASFHFEPSAKGFHYAQRSYQSWLGTAFAYGRNDVKIARDLGHESIFAFIAYSYRWLNPLTRLCVRLSIRRDGLRRILSTCLKKGIIENARFQRLKSSRAITRYALSGIYAMEYYRGLVSELGSVEALSELVKSGDQK